MLLLDLDATPFRELHRDDRSSAPRCAAGPGCARVRRGTVTQALVAALAGQLITSREASAIEWRVAARAAPACGDLRLPPTRAEHRGPARPPSWRPAASRPAGPRPSPAWCARSTPSRCAPTAPPPWRPGWAASAASVAGRPASRPSGGSGAWTWASWATSASSASRPGCTAGPPRPRTPRPCSRPFGEWAGLASLHLLAHPWAAAPAPGGASGLRPGARWTRRTSPAGPRATPPAPAPRPRTSPRPPPGELAGDLGAHLLALGEPTSRPSARTVTTWSARERSLISIQGGSGS